MGKLKSVFNGKEVNKTDKTIKDKEKGKKDKFLKQLGKSPKNKKDAKGKDSPEVHGDAIKNICGLKKDKLKKSKNYALSQQFELLKKEKSKRKLSSDSKDAKYKSF